MTQKFLTFKWTTSRGRNTYGYNICSLYVDGKKVASCSGGGYDMQGSCFGDWLEKQFKEEIKTLDVDKYYGLSEYNGVRHLDGTCGLSSMRNIANAIGYKLVTLPSNNKNEDYYLFQQFETH
jgi:hypothetical protein